MIGNMDKLEVLQSSSGYYIPSKKYPGANIASCYCGEVSIIPNRDYMDGIVNSIMGFFVVVDERNKGLGTEFMRQVIELERAKGTSYLTLGVDDRNEHVIKLYEKCGFQRDGYIRDQHLIYMFIKL